MLRPWPPLAAVAVLDQARYEMTIERDVNEWRALSELDDSSRESAMREWFEELLAIPADARSELMESMLLAEQQLEDDAFAAMTLSRLRT
jgi:hypothetical protein